MKKPKPFPLQALLPLWIQRNLSSVYFKTDAELIAPPDTARNAAISAAKGLHPIAEFRVFRVTCPHSTMSALTEVRGVRAVNLRVTEITSDLGPLLKALALHLERLVHEPDQTCGQNWFTHHAEPWQRYLAQLTHLQILQTDDVVLCTTTHTASPDGRGPIATLENLLPPALEGLEISAFWPLHRDYPGLGVSYSEDVESFVFRLLQKHRYRSLRLRRLKVWLSCYRFNMDPKECRGRLRLPKLQEQAKTAFASPQYQALKEACDAAHVDLVFEPQTMAAQAVPLEIFFPSIAQ